MLSAPRTRWSTCAGLSPRSTPTHSPSMSPSSARSAAATRRRNSRNQNQNVPAGPEDSKTKTNKKQNPETSPMPADDMNFKVVNHKAADTLELSVPETETHDAGPAAPAKKKHSLKRKAALLTLAGIVAKVGVGFGVWWWMDGQYKVTTDNAYVGA